MEIPLHKPLNKLAAESGIAPGCIRRAIRCGELAAYQPGGKCGSVYVRVHEFWGWLTGAKVATHAEPPLAGAGQVEDAEWSFQP